MMYKYYSSLRFNPKKHNEEGKYIHNGIFNNIPHFIKNSPHVNFLKYGFVMYNNKVLIQKQDIIPTINDSMIPMDFCQKNNLSLILLLPT